eukprot:TRINITY_DN951_c0_g2_i1.p1 TRINITY_DN951_c0_g2~~TRINITY_DN951_c0_g2_i1.p1  ORF type:complete len:223 (-),score=8.19 TRINITY_DN951_c0_g2_i1:81-749(-)
MYINICLFLAFLVLVGSSSPPKPKSYCACMCQSGERFSEAFVYETTVSSCQKKYCNITVCTSQPQCIGVPTVWCDTDLGSWTHSYNLVSLNKTACDPKSCCCPKKSIKLTSVDATTISIKTLLTGLCPNGTDVTINQNFTVSYFGVLTMVLEDFLGARVPVKRVNDEIIMWRGGSCSVSGQFPSINTPVIIAIVIVIIVMSLFIIFILVFRSRRGSQAYQVQ